MWKENEWPKNALCSVTHNIKILNNGYSAILLAAVGLVRTDTYFEQTTAILNDCTKDIYYIEGTMIVLHNIY